MIHKGSPKGSKRAPKGVPKGSEEKGIQKGSKMERGSIFGTEGGGVHFWDPKFRKMLEFKIAVRLASRSGSNKSGCFVERERPMRQRHTCITPESADLCKYHR